MNKYLLNIVTACTLFVMCGCKDDSATPNLTVNAEELQVPYSGGVITLPVTCSVASKATIEYGNPEETGWIFMLPTVLNSNGILELRIQSLKNMWEDRTATIIITAGTEVKTVKLLQTSKLHLSVEPSFIAASSNAGSYPVAVTSKTTWTATLSDGASWCTLSNSSGSNNGTFTVNVIALPDENQRTTTITVSGSNGLRETITVQQSYVSDYVEINGLLWAKCDVGEPGNFTSAPDVPGLLYQYNSKVGWPIGGANDPAPAGFPTGQVGGMPEWKQENNPCPDGWRIPTVSEIEALVGNAGNPKFAWRTSAQSGFAIDGAVVGIPASEAAQATKDNMRGGIFIPKTGYRNRDNGSMSVWWPVNITSSTSINEWDRYVMWIDGSGGISTRDWQGNLAAFPVRCVRNK
ncbi:MAG: hypothetical protein LBH32_05145 [Dysgonamonadaceae bacterium]|jgi:uncharacterized protein (TIGR02145 family)|nr:hypothetical protein [Dysgonamonadaceae bacterium]